MRFLKGNFLKERNSLITFLFHRIFLDEKEINLDLVYPQEKITIQYFRRFVEYFLSRGYNFISPDDILKGLDASKRHILITFDDGYYDNHRVLPTLKEYKAPAMFFISTNYVKYNKSFWWDIIYRERKKSGISGRKILRELRWLMHKKNEEIERYIVYIFGEKSFKLLNDAGRFFTPAELKIFSKERYVFLGNHTSDHTMLTTYSISDVKLQLLGAQNTLYDITGTRPSAVSYPYGIYTRKVISAAKEAGLQLGFSVESKKNYLPISFRNHGSMELGRFILMGDINIEEQCKKWHIRD